MISGLAGTITYLCDNGDKTYGPRVVADEWYTLETGPCAVCGAFVRTVSIENDDFKPQPYVVEQAGRIARVIDNCHP